MNIDMLDVYSKNVARVAHQLNKVYCESIGDNSQVDWDDAEAWQKDSALLGVMKIYSGEIKGPGDSHRSWLHQKVDDGWKYGPLKDPATKEHPCMVPFEQLPKEQQIKDHLFFGIVSILKPIDKG